MDVILLWRFSSFSSEGKVDIYNTLIFRRYYMYYYRYSLFIRKEVYTLSELIEQFDCIKLDSLALEIDHRRTKQSEEKYL